MLSIMWFILLICNRNNAANPTNSPTVPHEFYNNPGNATIKCSTGVLCTIDCSDDLSNGCRNVTINALGAIAVEIDCFSSCENAIFFLKDAPTTTIQIIGGPGGGQFTSNNVTIITQNLADGLEIECTDAPSCQRLTIHADNRVTLKCYSDYSCQDVHLYCINNIMCNIYCVGGEFSCYNMHFYIDNRFSQNLNGTGQVFSGDITCIDTNIASVFSNNICENYGCCPFTAGNFVCAAGADCYISCSLTSCINHLVDATMATSLTIDCNSGCMGSFIACPVGSDASCIIQCTGDLSCQFLYVQTDANSNINYFELSCSGTKSCANSRIYLYSINMVNIYCGGINSCNGQSYINGRTEFVFDGVFNHFLLLCDSYVGSCSNLHLRGMSSTVYNFSMVCLADCNNMNISATINDYATINCSNWSNCQGSVFQMILSNTAKVNIYCSNDNHDNDHGTCYNSYFWVNSKDTVNNNIIDVICGYNDCINTKFNLYNLETVNMVCEDHNSCKSSVINVATSNKLNLQCNDFGSCQLSDIYCPSHDLFVCNIKCSTDGLSCEEMNIYVSDLYKYDYINVNCPIHSTSCDQMNFICSGNKNLESTTLIFDYDENIYKCQTYGPVYCCPYLNQSINNVYIPTKSPLTTAPENSASSLKPISSISTNPSSDVSTLYTYISLSIVFIFLVISISGWIDSYFIHTNDMFRIIHTITFGIYTMDFMSDIFFAVTLFDTANWILFMLSCSCLILPMIINLMELRKAINYWIVDEENGLFIINYLKKYSKTLYAISMISGSGFAAIKLLNSCLWRINIFNMGLKQHQMNEFQNKRLVSVVLCENVPQIIVLIIYLILTRKYGGITLMSLIFSVFSIILSIFEYSTQKALTVQQSVKSEVYSIKLNIISEEVCEKRDLLRYQQFKLNRKIAEIYHIDKLSVEQLRPMDINDGLQLIFRVRMNKTENINYSSTVKDIISDSIQNESMSKYIKASWKLTIYPLIQNVSVSFIDDLQLQHGKAKGNVSTGVEMQSDYVLLRDNE